MCVCVCAGESVGDMGNGGPHLGARLGGGTGGSGGSSAAGAPHLHHVQGENTARLLFLKGKKAELLTAKHRLSSLPVTQKLKRSVTEVSF